MAEMDSDGYDANCSAIEKTGDVLQTILDGRKENIAATKRAYEAAVNHPWVSEKEKEKTLKQFSGIIRTAEIRYNKAFDLNKAFHEITD